MKTITIKSAEEMKKDEERKNAQLTVERAGEFMNAINIVLDRRYLNAYLNICTDKTKELLSKAIANFTAELQKSYLYRLLKRE